jgi:hypothetical protein
MGKPQRQYECSGEEKNTLHLPGIEPWIIGPFSVHSENYTIPTSRTISGT